jgi:putative sigma-54 modulation protein
MRDLAFNCNQGGSKRAALLSLFIGVENGPLAKDRHRQRTWSEGRMLIEIRAKDFALTDGIRLHIERRLGFALDRFEKRVSAVIVWVGDLNGHKQGPDDKCCRLAIRLTHRIVVLEERAADLYVAIDRAAHRARKAIAREVRCARRPASLRLQVPWPRSSFL